MNHRTPGLPVHHQLLEFTQTHVHRVRDAIQPSYPLLSPSPPAPHPSQHQSFPMSQLFTWGGQSTRVSASASFLPKKSQGWSPSEWTAWISLQSTGLSRVFSNTTVQQSILRCSAFFTVQLSHPYMTTGKTTALTRWTFVGKVMSLLFYWMNKHHRHLQWKSDRRQSVCKVHLTKALSEIRQLCSKGYPTDALLTQDAI